MRAMAVLGPLSIQLEKHLPFEFIKLFNQPDGHFPNGVPNPMLEENRAPTDRRDPQAQGGS